MANEAIGYRLERLPCRENPEDFIEALLDRLNEVGAQGWHAISVDLTHNPPYSPLASAGMRLPVLLARAGGPKPSALSTAWTGCHSTKIWSDTSRDSWIVSTSWAGRAGPRSAWISRITLDTHRSVRQGLLFLSSYSTSPTPDRLLNGTGVTSEAAIRRRGMGRRRRSNSGKSPTHRWAHLAAQEVSSMKCYVHAKEGSREEAVAICAVCGMAVCLDHAVERNVPLTRLQSPGLAGYPDRSMVILCRRDAGALPDKV